MTNEEVIKELIAFKDKSWDGMPEEVIDVAIKSLEAWNEVQKEIYRQIDALDEIHEFRDKKAYFTTLEIINKYLKEVEE